MSTLALTGSIVGVYDTLTPFQQAVAGYFSKFHGATLRAYKQDLEQYFDWCAQQNLPPMAAKRFHVEMYLRWLIDHPRGYSESTVARRITAVHGFYKTAVDDELLDRDPSRAVKAPKVDFTKQHRTLLTPNQFSIFIDHVMTRVSDVHEAALLMILTTRGVRISEACGLDIGHYTEIHGERIIRLIAKGNKAMELPLHPVSWRYIDAAIGDRKVGPILLNQAGNRMTRANASRIVKRIARAAGVNSDISPHSLRRSFITSALAHGEDIYAIQQTVGHSQVSTTARYDGLAGHRTRDRAYAITNKALGLAG